MLDTAQRVNLITRYCEEVIGADELPGLLDQGLPLRHYIGLEISGKLHLGTGLMCMQKVRDLQLAGVHCTIFLADWHTWINDKLGGGRESHQKNAAGHFKERLKKVIRGPRAAPSTPGIVPLRDHRHPHP